jgi:hypothetical protein
MEVFDETTIEIDNDRIQQDRRRRRQSRGHRTARAPDRGRELQLHRWTQGNLDRAYRVPIN